MTFLDTFIQRQRIKKALPYIPAAAQVLDIGCHKGEIFQALGNNLGYGIGIDPCIERNVSTNRYVLIKGSFPEDLSQPAQPDCITMLAVLEHILSSELEPVAQQCYRLLKNGGRLIVTVPSPYTDPLLKLLAGLKLIKGMSLEEHHGFRTDLVIPLFHAVGFRLVKYERFQLGLNNLFIFEKTFQPLNQQG